MKCTEYHYHVKAVEALEQLAVPVLQPMRLVDDGRTPVDLAQKLQVGDDDLVGRY